MTDPDQASGESPVRRRPGMPRWMIGFIVVAVLLAALVVLLLALGHGPGQHMSGSEHDIPVPGPAASSW